MITATISHSAESRQSLQSTSLQNAVVVIPARNEELSLPLVLHDLPDVGRIIVVDNGSTDRTSAVAQEYGATVVREERPGYGSACLAGLQAIRDFVFRGDPAPAAVVFIDADYSDQPQLLPKLVQPILLNQVDFVLGSRLLGEREPGAMPPQSVYGNKLACFLMRQIWGAQFTDLGPFRAIGYDSLRMLAMTDQNFGWTVEMQIKAIVHGLRIAEIPVPYRCRIGTSKISGTFSGTIRAGTKILYTIAKYAWKVSWERRAEHFTV